MQQTVNMDSAQISTASSPPTSPSNKKLSFGMDSLLARKDSVASEERAPSTHTSDSQEQAEEMDEHHSSVSNRSSPHSDISNSTGSNNLADSLSHHANIPALSMAAALHQRASFMRQNTAASQLPHHALLYPWLMSAGLMPNPASAILSPTSPTSPSKSAFHIHFHTFYNYLLVR